MSYTEFYLQKINYPISFKLDQIITELCVNGKKGHINISMEVVWDYWYSS